MTVTNHNVAAVVAPRTNPSRRGIAPPPINPTPVKMRHGKRIRSILMKESGVLPFVASNKLV